MEDALKPIRERLELVREYEHVIFAQLRKLGVELYDDAGNRLPPGGGQEARIVMNIAREVAHLAATKAECQTPPATSCWCRQNEVIGGVHHPSCPEYPAPLKDA